MQHTTYHNHRAEPYFTFAKNGQKTVEGRIGKSWYRNVLPGDRIIVSNNEETDSFEVEVVDVRLYATIREMLENEDLKKVLPDVDTVEQGVRAYRRFYTEEQEKEFGVVAIEVRRVMEQQGAATHAMSLNHESFAKIANGTKTIEARLLDEKRRAIRPGDTVELADRESGAKLTAKVARIVTAPSFKDLFVLVTPEALGHGSVSECVALYEHYSPEQERLLGVVGIVLEDIVLKA